MSLTSSSKPLEPDSGALPREIALEAAVPSGLTRDEAQRRLVQFGPNSIPEKLRPAWQVYVAKFWSPIPWLLEAAMVAEIGLGKYVEAAVIATLLLFNATLGFVQEGRAGAALKALKKRLSPTALVRRDGEWITSPASELVPGDIVSLSLGALVPADARLLSGAVLVDQSMLTGESAPVDAMADSQVFAGSLIKRGQAIAEVTETGTKTYFGRTAELVRTAQPVSTEQAAVFSVTRNLMIVNGTAAFAVIVYAYVAALPPGALISLGLTALLATIPVALPATFTLSAAFGAQTLARRGVLLTRLSAAHEAAAMDVLCADKTGTLTRNTLEVVEVIPLRGINRERVLQLAALASSEAGQDPIDGAIRAAAAKASNQGVPVRRLRFVPFDPARKISEAFISDPGEREQRIVKGAFETIAATAEVPAGTADIVNDLAGRGHRVLAVAAGSTTSVGVVGLIALSDPPREDSPGLIAALRDLGVRTVMVTGDSATTGAAIARKVGIDGSVCPAERIADDLSTDQFGVFARVVPEQKFWLVKALQSHHHVVGMCGDGVNDAPALKQAQIGIAVSSATDVAKAAAGMVLTEPGLAGILSAVREGRIGFQRLLTYAFNMLVKKVEIVLFLAVGLAITGHAIMTPALMVVLFMTNDFLSMSLTTDRASYASSPSAWHMRNITVAAIVLGLVKLAFSAGVLAVAKFKLGLAPGQLQTLAFVTLVFGAQAVLFALRERREMWASRPSVWVMASSATDVAIASVLALSGTLMEPLPWQVLAKVFVAAAVFALIFDLIKLLIISALKVE